MVYFDNNLDSVRANRLLRMMNNGHFLDRRTKSIDIYIMTFTGQMGVYVLTHVNFELDATGTVSMDWTIASSKHYYYYDSLDAARFVFEVLCLIFCVGYGISELRELHSMGFWYYFGDDWFWNMLDWCHLIAVFGLIVQWMAFNMLTLAKFRPKGHYDVYQNTEQYVRPLYMNVTDNHAELRNLLKTVHELDHIMYEMGQHQFGRLVAMLLFIVKMLKTFDFQPRLGVITQTLRHAMRDLFHFFLIFFTILFIYALAASYTFGVYIEDLSSVSRSLVTCLVILLGEIAVWEELVKTPFPVSAFLWFWSWIVLGFFIVLNVLLAIIVNSYSKVREESDRATTLFRDMVEISQNALANFTELHCSKHDSEEHKFYSDKDLLGILEDIVERQKKEQHRVEKVVQIRSGVMTLNDGELGEESEKETSASPFNLCESELVDVLTACTEGTCGGGRTAPCSPATIRTAAREIVRRFGQPVKAFHFSQRMGDATRELDEGSSGDHHSDGGGGGDGKSGEDDDAPGSGKGGQRWRSQMKRSLSKMIIPGEESVGEDEEEEEGIEITTVGRGEEVDPDDQEEEKVGRRKQQVFKRNPAYVHR